jgi:hypothetical protein
MGMCVCVCVCVLVLRIPFTIFDLINKIFSEF